MPEILWVSHHYLHSQALENCSIPLPEQRISVLNGIVHECDSKKSYDLKKIDFKLAFKSR
jgi:hypothetical protein